MEFSHTEGETCVYECSECGNTGEMPMAPDEEYFEEQASDEEDTEEDTAISPTPECVSDWL